TARKCVSMTGPARWCEMKRRPEGAAAKFPRGGGTVKCALRADAPGVTQPLSVAAAHVVAGVAVVLVVVEAREAAAGPADDGGRGFGTGGDRGGVAHTRACRDQAETDRQRATVRAVHRHRHLPFLGEEESDRDHDAQ